MDQGQLDATSQPGSGVCFLRQTAPARCARVARGPMLEGGMGGRRRLPGGGAVRVRAEVWAMETCLERGEAGLFLSCQVGPTWSGGWPRG